MKLYSYFALLLPLGIMLLSWGISSLIPGCTIDEGAGASADCGAIGPLLAFGVMGGFLWFMFGVLGFLPAFFIWMWKNRNLKENTPSEFSFKTSDIEARNPNDKNNF